MGGEGARGGGGGGLNRFYVATSLALSSAVVYTRHLFSPREGFRTHQCNISENIKNQTKTEMKQRPLSTSKLLRLIWLLFGISKYCLIKWQTVQNITKTYLYNFDPLKPHFHIVKLGFTGVYIIFLLSAQNIDYGYSLEPPRRGGSNEYPQSMFWAEIWKNIRVFFNCFLPENFRFLEVKFTIYLNRRVFVMIWVG